MKCKICKKEIRKTNVTEPTGKETICLSCEEAEAE